ncbi:MAG: DUF3833 family protein [Granulosicoccus sp.]
MIFKSVKVWITFAALAVSLSGCSDMKLESVAKDSPKFDFVEFFLGHTRASGWFSDRFGKPRRHFCGDFQGTIDGDTFVLTEKLFYSDGVVEDRIWRVKIGDGGSFIADSDSLLGQAKGRIVGNTLAMEYAMSVKIQEGKQWELDMKDYMMLQPDGSLHNITQVYKWGVRIGSVSTQYQHHDGNASCSVARGEVSS